MRRRSRAALIATALVAVGTASAGAAEITARLVARAVPEGHFVRFEEVASFQGDASLGARAAGVLLGRSPAPGGFRTISRGYIVSRLAAEGLDVSRVRIVGDGPVKLHGRPVQAPVAKIRRAAGGRAGAGGAGALSAGERSRLEKRIGEICAGRSGFEPGDMQVEIKNVRLPRGAADADSLEVDSVTGRRSLGRVTASLSGRFGGDRGAAGVVYADVAAVREALAPSRALKGGHVLGAEDLRTVTVAVRSVSEDYLYDGAALVGKQLSKSMAAGEPLRGSQVSAPELVRRGEAVTVLVRSTGFRVTDRAVARQSGTLGDAIEVENPRSRKAYLAVVTGPRTVRPVVYGEVLITDGKGKR